MKRVISCIAALSIFFGLATDVHANVQIGVKDFDVDNVFYVLGEDVVTGNPIVNPTMTVSWVDPDAWANDVEIHTPDYYGITVKNITTGKNNDFKILKTNSEYTTKTVNIHDKMTLETGSLYELAIQPYHDHRTTVGGNVVVTPAPNVEAPRKAYAVTDLKVAFESDEDSIKITWDDLGILDFKYRIVYALGDYTSRTKTDLINNKEGEILGLTKDSTGVTAFEDPATKRNKLSYTLNNNILPGQIYSVMVEPIADTYSGGVVARNRNSPYIQSVSTNIVLSMTEEGDYLRLSWNIPDGFRIGTDKSEYALVEATLVATQGGSERNLVIFDGSNATIGYYRTEKPKWETTYQLKLKYSAVADSSKPDIKPISNKVTYSPADYLITPTKPYVPKVITQKIIDDLGKTYGNDMLQISPILAKDYLVPGDSYTAPLTDLLAAKKTFHIDDTAKNINFVWGAFKRLDVNPSSPTYGKSIYDNNVYYDIWVTDELSSLAFAPRLFTSLRYSSTKDSHVILNGTSDIIGFKQDLNTYYDTATRTNKKILADDIYYIKIQAKKITGVKTFYSEPTIVAIYYTYDGSTFEPPTIAKPPLTIEEDKTTTNSMTIRWKTNWHEVISPDYASDSRIAPLENWLHKAWVDSSGKVYTKETSGATLYPIYKGKDETDDFIKRLTGAGITAKFVTREVDLGKDSMGQSDVKYKFIAIPYETVKAAIEKGKADVKADYDFDDYFKNLVEKDRDGTTPLSWEEITPVVDPNDKSYLTFKKDALLENTAYMLVLYPYRELQNGQRLYAHYPTPIVGATKPKDSTITPDPTVPNIFVTGSTDMSVEVRWKYNLDFKYTLMYGLEEDVTKAKEWPITLPTDTSDPKYPKDGAYYPVTVDDLFPNTTYYFWVKATQTSNGKASNWSPPAVGRTKDVDAPPPPRGLGIAPVSALKEHKMTQSVTQEYIVVQWLLDLADKEDTSDSKVKKTIQYIVELSDNKKFIDPVYVVTSGGSEDVKPDTVEILKKNLLKFKDLIGNRHYYVRAKTRVVVKGSEEGQLLKKDSAFYTEPIRIITLAKGDEYDGTIDPALTILPTEDYEILYNKVSKTLEYRFRTDKTDANGNKDNQVDQRLISSLIKDDISEYVIDLDGFRDQEVERRRVTIPYTVMEAFDSHDVAIKVLADNMTMGIPASGLIDKVTAQVNAYGVAPTITIDMEEKDRAVVEKDLPTDTMTSVTTPQELQMNVRSSRKTDGVTHTDAPMNLTLKTDNRYDVYNKDMAVYVKDNQANWSEKEGTYDRYTARMAFDTPVVGTYGLFAYDRPTAAAGNTNPAHWSENARKAVYEAFTIKGLSGYNPDGKVSEKAMVQAVYGTVMKQPAVDLSGRLTGAEMTSLVRSGIKGDSGQGDGTISREEAIGMFARASEIKDGIIVNVTPAQLSAVRSAGASDTHSVNVAKAVAMGLISDTSGLRPGDALTYGEYFTLWSKIID